MALSDEMKELLAAFAPMVQGLVDTAVKVALPAGVGTLAATVFDTGVAAIENHNPKYFPSAGVQPVVQDPNASDVSKALGNAPLVPAAPTLPVAGNMSLTDLEAAFHALSAKVDALSAATGMQTSAAMAAH